MIKSFLDLDVYKESFQLNIEVEDLLKTYPKNEEYLLVDQSKRASRGNQRHATNSPHLEQRGGQAQLETVRARTGQPRFERGELGCLGGLEGESRNQRTAEGVDERYSWRHRHWLTSRLVRLHSDEGLGLRKRRHHRAYSVSDWSLDYDKNG